MLASLLSTESHGWLYLSFGNILALLVALFVVGVSCNALFNRYLHALRDFPGPFWGSVTDFYNTCLFATSQVHLKMLKLHEKHGESVTPFAVENYNKTDAQVQPGSVIRIAPNLLSFSDPFLLPEIYHRHVEKTPFYSTAMTGETPPLVLAQSDTEHATKLKLLSPTVCLI